MMELLKMATLRTNSTDSWELKYLSHVVVKNGARVVRSVKRERKKIEDPEYSLDLQDVWAALNSTEAFTIAASV